MVGVDDESLPAVTLQPRRGQGNVRRSRTPRRLRLSSARMLLGKHLQPHQLNPHPWMLSVTSDLKCFLKCQKGRHQLIIIISVNP